MVRIGTRPSRGYLALREDDFVISLLHHVALLPSARTRPVLALIMTLLYYLECPRTHDRMIRIMPFVVQRLILTNMQKMYSGFLLSAVLVSAALVRLYSSMNIVPF